MQRDSSTLCVSRDAGVMRGWCSGHDGQARERLMHVVPVGLWRDPKQRHPGDLRGEPAHTSDGPDCFQADARVRCIGDDRGRERVCSPEGNTRSDHGIRPSRPWQASAGMLAKVLVVWGNAGSPKRAGESD